MLEDSQEGSDDVRRARKCIGGRAYVFTTVLTQPFSFGCLIFFNDEIIHAEHYPLLFFFTWDNFVHESPALPFRTIFLLDISTMGKGSLYPAAKKKKEISGR